MNLFLFMYLHNTANLERSKMEWDVYSEDVRTNTRAIHKRVDTLSTRKNAIIVHWMTARFNTPAKHFNRKVMGENEFLKW